MLLVVSCFRPASAGRKVVSYFMRRWQSGQLHLTVNQAPFGLRRFAQSDDRTNHFIMFYIYFLKLSNGDIYKGFTEDLKRRLEEHNQGRVNSTKNYRPLILIGYEAYKLKSDAIRREKFLKTTEGRRLLKQQLRDILK